MPPCSTASASYTAAKNPDCPDYGGGLFDAEVSPILASRFEAAVTPAALGAGAGTSTRLAQLGLERLDVDRGKVADEATAYVGGRLTRDERPAGEERHSLGVWLPAHHDRAG